VPGVRRERSRSNYQYNPRPVFFNPRPAVFPKKAGPAEKNVRILAFSSLTVYGIASPVNCGRGTGSCGSDKTDYGIVCRCGRVLPPPGCSLASYFWISSWRCLPPNAARCRWTFPFPSLFPRRIVSGLPRSVPEISRPCTTVLEPGSECRYEAVVHPRLPRGASSRMRRILILCVSANPSRTVRSASDWPLGHSFFSFFRVVSSP